MSYNFGGRFEAGVGRRSERRELVGGDLRGRNANVGEQD